WQKNVATTKDAEVRVLGSRLSLLRRAPRILRSSDPQILRSSDPSMLASPMPSGFTRDEVAAIAALAHLELDASEIDLFARQLGEVLAYAAEVQQIDTTGGAATA